jgi:hypothetical protein
MPRRPDPDRLERDAKAADLYRAGLTYRQIGAQLGIRSTSNVGAAIRRHAFQATRESLSNAESLRIILDRLQDYRRIAYRIAAGRHYATTVTGKTVTGPDGNPALDTAPNLAAIDRLLRCEIEEIKLRGLYAPAQARIEIVTEDMIEAEIRRLESELEAEADIGSRNPDHPSPT